MNRIILIIPIFASLICQISSAEKENVLALSPLQMNLSSDQQFISKIVQKEVEDYKKAKSGPINFQFEQSVRHIERGQWHQIMSKMATKEECIEEETRKRDVQLSEMNFNAQIFAEDRTNKYLKRLLILRQLDSINTINTNPQAQTK